jgi:glycosyltransferase involved in cell wall biosynthesis
LVLDGGSTDESVEVIRRYEDRLAFWVSEPDDGQSAAINRGFRRATGDIVTWLNSDDFFLPGALQRIAKAFRESPTASFYFGDGWRVDESGRRTSNFFPHPVRFDRRALLFGIDYVLQPAAFINREHLHAVGYLNIDLKYGMDFDLWMRLSAIAEPVVVTEALAASREYGDTKTATGSFARIEELRRIAELHSGCGLTPGVLAYFLDTLLRHAKERPDAFSREFLDAVPQFWAQVNRLFPLFGCGEDGFPPLGTQGAAQRAPAPTTEEQEESRSCDRQTRNAASYRSRGRRLLDVSRRAYRLLARKL